MHVNPEVTVEILDEQPGTHWIDWPSWQDDCPCGSSRYVDRDRASHAHWHLNWAYGMPYPNACPYLYESGLAMVTWSSALVCRRLAFHMAQLFRREQHYDFAQLPPAGGWRQHYPNIQAYMPLWHGRAVGIAIVGRVTAWGWDRADEKGYIHFDQTESALAIAGIFVCGNYRRNGLGERLVREVARVNGQKPAHLAWSVPLTEGGRALANKFTQGENLRLCGGVPWESKPGI